MSKHIRVKVTCEIEFDLEILICVSENVAEAIREAEVLMSLMRLKMNTSLIR
jgi:hypothetical protein